MEFFGDLIFNTLFSVTGAFVRWLFLWRKRSYASLLDDIELNVFIGVVSILFPFLVVTLCKYYL